MYTSVMFSVAGAVFALQVLSDVLTQPSTMFRVKPDWLVKKEKNVKKFQNRPRGGIGAGIIK